MTYFTFQRLITFSVGIIILYLANLAYENTDLVYHYVLAITGLLIGMYIVIASLIPYKSTTKGVAEMVFEGLFQYIIEIPFKFIINLFTH